MPWNEYVKGKQNLLLLIHQDGRIGDKLCYYNSSDCFIDNLKLYFQKISLCVVKLDGILIERFVPVGFHNSFELTYTTRGNSEEKLFANVNDFDQFMHSFSTQKGFLIIRSTNVSFCD